jgi:hypothetical protein
LRELAGSASSRELHWNCYSPACANDKASFSNEARGDVTTIQKL